MKREQLRKILESETEVSEKIDKILDSFHDEVDSIKSELNTANDQKSALEEELKTANETISNLENNAENSEAVAQEIESYKSQIEELTRARDQEKVSNAIELAIIQAKGKNTKAIRALLDNDKIRLESDGTVSGIDDQIKTLAKTDSYMFESEEEKKPAKTSTGYNGPQGTKSESKEKSKSQIERFVKKQNEKSQSISAKPLFSE